MKRGKGGASKVPARVASSSPLNDHHPTPPTYTHRYWGWQDGGSCTFRDIGLEALKYAEVRLALAGS